MSQHSEKSDWTRPLLRWAGSKRQLLPELRAALPTDWRRYVEPFAGSACFFFSLKPNEAILGDFNKELIHFYSILKKHPRLLAREVHSFEHTADEYYRIRAIPLNELDEITRAAHFLYLNRLCFNGVYRTNRSGMFNVPMGRNSGAIPIEQAFYRCSIALRNATTVAGDFELTCAKAKRRDFVYLDPPYSSSSRNRSGEYGYDSFQPPEIERLVECIESLNDRGAFFLLSYTDSSQVRKAMSKWNIQRLKVRRHVAGFAEHRKKVGEVLIANYSFGGLN